MHNQSIKSIKFKSMKYQSINQTIIQINEICFFSPMFDIIAWYEPESINQSI